jgi:hypothetical protein
MITTAMYADIKVAVQRIIDEYKVAMTDNVISFSEAASLLAHAAGSFVPIVEELVGSGDGAGKKQIVLDALAELYDQVLAPLEVRSLPAWIAAMTAPLLRKALLEGAAVSIDVIVAMFVAKPTPQPVPAPVTPQGFTPVPFTPKALMPMFLKGKAKLA